MICPFCSQWNPDEGQLRCCFCNNRLDEGEDRTRAGIPDYARGPTGPLPRVHDRGDGPGDPGIHGVGSMRDIASDMGRKEIGLLIAMLVSGAVIVIYLFTRC